MSEQGVTAIYLPHRTQIDSRHGGATTCARCQAPTPCDVPLWMVSIGRLVGSPLVGLCTACRDEHFSNYYDAGTRWLAPQACANCGCLVCYRDDSHAHARRYAA